MRDNVRRQLTLFLENHYSKDVEEIRKKYNSVQFHLIRSHVTLCREDELKNLAQIKNNLKSLNLGFITINFDKISRFSDGDGVTISASENNLQYHQLRQMVLKGSNIEVKYPKPHITLMHPRNSTCTNEIFNSITKFNIPKSILFREVSLIEQIDTNEWKIIETFKI